MTLRSLAVRTKKSLSGLYTLAHVEQPSAPPETPKKTTPKTCASTPDGASPVFSEYGVSPSSMESSRTDTSSKRNKLVRSLRKMRSSFDVLRSKASDDSKTHRENALPAKPRPSLTLDFEVSPPGQPMFVTARVSPQSSGVHHSSPIAVPSGKRTVPAGEASLPVGAVPDSPAPLMKVCVQETILAAPVRPVETPSAPLSPDAPLPTPMPGTHLPLDDVQHPEIIVSHPSVPLMDADGYFALTAMQDELSGSKQKAPSKDVQDESEPPKSDCGADEDGIAKHDFVTDKQAAETVPNELNDQCALDSETPTSSERKSEYAPCYLALGDPETPGDTQRKLVRRRSTWSRHTGLYDGSGYAASDSIEDDHATQATINHPTVPEHPENKANEAGMPATRPSGEFISDGRQASLEGKQSSLQDILRAIAKYDRQERGEGAVDISTPATASTFGNGSKEHVRAASQPIESMGFPRRAAATRIEA